MGNSFYKGRLQHWDDDKGYGFIQQEGPNKHNIFIHISAFKKISRRPVIGDNITYQIHTGNMGKTKAINATIEGVLPISKNLSKQKVKSKNYDKFVFKPFLILFILMIIGLFFYFKNGPDLPKNREEHTNSHGQDLLENEENQITYRCEGKIHCSQMVSCQEAMFYLNNCPGTKMDEDGDGIPCEKQCRNQW